MIQQHLTTLKERLTCFIAHDYTRWQTKQQAIVVEKARRCKRNGCSHSEVVYQ
jgi:hypothetical protein